jgi:hypothetical protein
MLWFVASQSPSTVLLVLALEKLKTFYVVCCLLFSGLKKSNPIFVVDLDFERENGSLTIALPKKLPAPISLLQQDKTKTFCVATKQENVKHHSDHSTKRFVREIRNFEI